MRTTSYRSPTRNFPHSSKTSINLQLVAAAAVANRRRDSARRAAVAVGARFCSKSASHVNRDYNCCSDLYLTTSALDSNTRLFFVVPKMSAFWFDQLYSSKASNKAANCSKLISTRKFGQTIGVSTSQAIVRHAEILAARSSRRILDKKESAVVWTLIFARRF